LATARPEGTGGEGVWRSGDRVRIVEPDGPYTGCRGTVLEASGAAEGDQLPLGYFVAIDGENGVARPFLAAALERVTAAAARSKSASRTVSQSG